MKNVSRVWIMLPAIALLVTSISQDQLRADNDKVASTKFVKVGDITLIVPKAWKQTKPTSRLRLAQFEIPASGDDKEAAELSIFNFGAGGTVAQQVDRWKGQFLPQNREFSMEQGKIDLGDYVLVNLVGTFKKPDGPPVLRKTVPMPGAEMLVTMIVTENGNYFLKLVGYKATVSAAAADYRKSMGIPAKKPAGPEKE